jgi:hypothetical protein
MQYSERQRSSYLPLGIVPDQEGRFISNPSLHQMKDKDSLASQLRALYAIITISNTGALSAEGFGVPTCVIRDDGFQRSWPVLSDRTPWRPNTRVFGIEVRPWAAVLTEICLRPDEPGLHRDE